MLIVRAECWRLGPYKKWETGPGRTGLNTAAAGTGFDRPESTKYRDNRRSAESVAKQVIDFKSPL